MSAHTPTPAPVAQVKKSVALSGIVAGNTAICTVGQSGNDLRYRGDDIADLAAAATCEEVAHLLIHERLPAPRRGNSTLAAKGGGGLRRPLRCGQVCLAHVALRRSGDDRGDAGQ